MSGIADFTSSVDSGFGFAGIIFAGKSNSDAVVGLGDSLAVGNAVVSGAGISLFNASCLACNDFLNGELSIPSDSAAAICFSVFLIATLASTIASSSVIIVLALSLASFSSFATVSTE